MRCAERCLAVSLDEEMRDPPHAGHVTVPVPWQFRQPAEPRCSPLAAFQSSDLTRLGKYAELVFSSSSPSRPSATSGTSELAPFFDRPSMAAGVCSLLSGTHRRWHRMGRTVACRTVALCASSSVECCACHARCSASLGAVMHVYGADTSNMRAKLHLWQISCSWHSSHCSCYYCSIVHKHPPPLHATPVNLHE